MTHVKDEHDLRHVAEKARHQEMTAMLTDARNRMKADISFAVLDAFSICAFPQTAIAILVFRKLTKATIYPAPPPPPFLLS
ncbi:hypothetical protein BaRGS_00015834 [Batillaria attramentaria]|uniref:Uncharacterized protein n=1 Tax=Batillaria attramentaria TaxID=370345 RepID=A0ABD0L0F4_9CAEN